MRHLEDAALAFDFLEVFLAACVSHVFAKDENPWVARHFVTEAGVEQVHHGARRPFCVGARAVKGRRSRVHIRRIDILGGRFRRWLRAGQRRIGRRVDFPFDIGPERHQVLFGGDALTQQEVGKGHERIAPGVTFPFGWCAVQPLIV